MRLLDREHASKIGLLAGPIILGLASQVVLNLVDMAMVGRLGAAAQGAAGIGSFLFLVLASLTTGAGTAVQAIVARRDGEQQPEAVGAALDQGLLVAVMLALPLGVLLSLAAEHVFPLLSDDPEVVLGGTSYLRIRLMAMGAVTANFVYRGFYNGIGETKVYMTTLIFIQVANVFGNWVFIFGNLGAPALGLSGAALASAGAALIGTVFYTTLTAMDRDLMRRARPYRPQNLRWNALRALGKLAVPEAVRGVLTMGGFMLFLRLHSELGTTELAAGTILVNLASMGFLPSMGMGLAGATLVGRHLGKGDPDQARRAVWEGVKLSMLILLPVLLLMLGFPDTVLGLFTPDPTVIELARVPLRLLGAMMGLDALPIVLVFSLLGAGITRWVAAVNLVQQYVILLPVAWLLGVQLQLGILGLWLGMGLSRVALALVVVPKFRSRSWESQQV